MFSNLTLLAILILVLWAGAFAYYFIVSRQQQDLSKEIETLKELLEDSESEAGNG